MRGLEHLPWFYDAWMALFERWGLGRWRRWLALGARGRTLEVGCGTGRNLPLYPQPIELVAFDPDLGLVVRARRRAERAVLLVADAHALPFGPQAFHTVVSSLVFCSVPDPQRGLAEIRRVLIADGQLRMVEHVRADHRLLALIQDLAHPAWKWVTGGCHLNRRTEQTVTAAGFTIATEGYRARREMRRFVAFLD